MKCTVCRHPQLSAIDLALLAGHTLESLHHQYGVSVSAVQRHKNHLKEKMRRARERLENSRKQDSLLKLSALLDHVQRGVEAAAAEGDTDKVFKGCQIGSRIIHQINKMDVPLDLGTVYRLVSSPGFASQDGILPAGPQIIADLHQALAASAFSPCPDNPTKYPAEDQDEDGSGVEEDYDPQDNSVTEDVGRENEVHPAALECDVPLETRNSTLETALHTAYDLFPDPCSLTTDHCSIPTSTCPPPNFYRPKKLRKTSAKKSPN